VQYLSLRSGPPLRHTTLSGMITTVYDDYAAMEIGLAENARAVLRVASDSADEVVLRLAKLKSEQADGKWCHSPKQDDRRCEWMSFANDGSVRGVPELMVSCRSGGAPPAQGSVSRRLQAHSSREAGRASEARPGPSRRLQQWEQPLIASSPVHSHPHPVLRPEGADGVDPDWASAQSRAN
jgi:hypothetical protein